MEHTTSEVVLGAQLANDAGAALEKVESVSRHLADLIENISAAAQQQAVMANKISQMMSVIENISKKAAIGTSETTDAIENVSNFVEDLRASVAGFNLPRE
jgi:twitching motility protein PilJ